jgi:hypothetical protein
MFASEYLNNDPSLLNGSYFNYPRVSDSLQAESKRHRSWTEVLKKLLKLDPPAPNLADPPAVETWTGSWDC